MSDRADRRFVGKLVGVSVVVVCGVLLYVRGTSRQLLVERRVDSIRALAAEKSVSLAALMALCVTESLHESGRTDAELALRLADAVQRSDGSEEAAFALLLPDDVERRLAVDLMRRNRARWERLAPSR